MIYPQLKYFFALFLVVKANKILNDCSNQTRFKYFNPTKIPIEQFDVKLFLTNRYFPRTELLLDGGFMNIHHFSSFLVTEHLTIIVHGFMSSSHEEWVKDMEKAIIKNYETNVITIDWSKGSKRLNYFQAMENTKTVSDVVARFLKEQIKSGATCPRNIHLIGQSLGAHLVSFIAQQVPGIGQITGLDPAEPGFFNADPSSRLDPSDAEYVEVIHTDTSKFFMSYSIGYKHPIGHVDFYMNGGSKQPGCQKLEKSFPIIRNYLTTKFTNLIKYLNCNHMKAQEYYTEILDMKNECLLFGVKWEPNKSMPAIDIECKLNNCQIVGPRGKYLPGRGIYYVKTQVSSPYCFGFQKSLDRKFLKYIIKKEKLEFNALCK